MFQGHCKLLLGQVNLEDQLLPSFYGAASLYSASLKGHVHQHAFAAYIPAPNLAGVPETILNRIPKVTTLLFSDGSHILM